jgi:hypothetical protein
MLHIGIGQTGTNITLEFLRQQQEEGGEKHRHEIQRVLFIEDDSSQANTLKK